LFPLEPYANLNDLEKIREKLEDSEAKATYPKARITDAYLYRIRENFNKQVEEQRVEILVDILMPDYTRENISKQAIIDAAKRKKVHYFLKQDADKMIKRVINWFRRTGKDDTVKSARPDERLG